MGLSLIIPAYNEGKNIGDVIQRVPSFVDEVIVVDDGSTDDTSEAVSKHPVKLIRHEKNFGKGKALRTGSKSAEGQIFVFMDADGQHNPAEIGALVKPILEGESDVVVGYRDLRSAPLIRKFSNFMAKSAIKIFTRQEVKDPLCGFRAISKDAFNKLQLTKEGYEFEFDMIFEASRAGLRVSNIPVSVDYGVGESSITPVDNVRIIFFVLKECVKKRLID